MKEKARKMREAFLKDREKYAKEPTTEFSQAGFERMNGPIGVEISKKEAKAIRVSMLSHKKIGK